MFWRLTAGGHPGKREHLRVLLVLKTNEGGMWTLPHIAEFQARGHEVVVLIPPGPGRLRTELDRRAVKVVDSAFDFRFAPGLRTLNGLRRFRRQIRAIDPDVVHYHLYASALAARIATLGSRTPRVHMVAGPLYLESTLIRAIERRLMKLDSVTICGSRYTADAYLRLGQKIDRAPVVPTEWTPPALRRRQLPHQRPSPSSWWRCSTHRNGEWHRGRGIKGHDTLLAAWSAFTPNARQPPGPRRRRTGRGRPRLPPRSDRPVRKLNDPARGVTVAGMADDVRSFEPRRT